MKQKKENKSNRKIMCKKLTILFWKTFAIFWDIRPRLHLPNYSDYPIAVTDIAEKYQYPEGIKILYEWDEKGKHYIAFVR